MNILHRSIDTFTKREWLFAAALFMLLLIGALCDLYFLVQVIPIHELEDLYALIPLASYSFIGSIILSVFNLITFTWQTITGAVFQAVHIQNWLVFIMACMLLFSKGKRHIPRVLLLAIGALLIVGYAGSGIFVLLSVGLTNYQAVLQQVIAVAWWLIAIHGIIAVLLFAGALYSVYHYILSMAYYAVEVSE